MMVSYEHCGVEAEEGYQRNYVPTHVNPYATLEVCGNGPSPINHQAVIHPTVGYTGVPTTEPHSYNTSLPHNHTPNTHLIDSCYSDYYPDYRQHWPGWTPANSQAGGDYGGLPQYPAENYLPENFYYSKTEYYEPREGQYPTPVSLSHNVPVLPHSLQDLKERSQIEWTTSHSTNNGKTRTKDKYRVVYTDHQRLELEKEFHYSRYITIRRKAELAVELGLSERQVKIWFQNRRAKERKISRKKSTRSSNARNSSSECPINSPSSCDSEEESSPNALTSCLNPSS